MALTLRIMTEPQMGASYDDQLAVAREAEALGFDAFFRSDHYMVQGNGDGFPGPTDAWITLAALPERRARLRWRPCTPRSSTSPSSP
jgi:alkanesulfonate monooxygenase SsuD/methylene tetrahydromethanopterin reductase-like flavin-dependent oxidoreductase (luciferase family)